MGEKTRGRGRPLLLREPLTRRGACTNMCEDLSGIVGAYDGEDPPVPIPNTVVKLLSADNTWLVTAREYKSVPTQVQWLLFAAAASYSSLAQLVEHAAVNRRVVGSSPTGGARKKALANASAFFKRNKSLSGFVKCPAGVKYAYGA